MCFSMYVERKLLNIVMKEVFRRKRNTFYVAWTFSVTVTVLR
jgi:hypothetical protein